MKKTMTHLKLIVHSLFLQGLLCLFILHSSVLAQDKVKKPVKGSLQFAEDTAGYSAADRHIFLFPEFYHYWPAEKKDTTYKYECYDVHNALMNVDTMNNVNDIKQILFIKSFTNYMHTFVDADGKPKPSIISRTLYKYDRIDSKTWKTFDFLGNYASELKENKNEIVRSDRTATINPENGRKQLMIRKYYQVIEQKVPGEITPASNGQ